jgi:hypothetical protein
MLPSSGLFMADSLPLMFAVKSFIEPASERFCFTSDGWKGLDCSQGKNHRHKINRPMMKGTLTEGEVSEQITSLLY